MIRNDKDWDDYVTGRPGTFFGEIKRKEMDRYISWSSNNSNSVDTDRYSPAGNDSFEDYVRAGLNLVVSLLALAYLHELNVAWYWYVVAFLVVACVVDWLLRGPLNFIVRGIAVLSYVAITLGVIYGILHWFDVF